MAPMAEPSPAADETFGLNRAETVAVPSHAASDEGERTTARDYDDGITSKMPAEHQSWSATWRKAGALLLGGLAMAGAIVFAFWLLSPDTRGSQSATKPKDGSPAPGSAPSAASAAPSSIASTPDQDNQYVKSLHDHGISFANPEAAVYNGKTVCDDIRRGITIPQIIAAFRASNPALSADADTYVAISVHAYCPQNSNLVGGGS
ncbi:MAG: DUF732 domain-containing protein [Mycobacterium sp.]|nr:DUF732 domain-containing protein [Mycobacterium sp.]